MRVHRKQVLYSTNTWLAYNIARMFYGDEHYVWCSPIFDGTSRLASQASPPPTSCPGEIYRCLLEEVRRRDRHSAKIAENRVGILKGSMVKRTSGVITENELSEIAAIVDAADVGDFAPLLYVIPYQSVRDLIKEVPVANRAHPLSEEFVIEALPGDLFDVIRLEGK